MWPYRCYFYTASGHIAALETVRCAGDDEAKETAARLFRERPCYAVELWDVGRQLTRLTQSGAVTLLGCPNSAEGRTWR